MKIYISTTIDKVYDLFNTRDGFERWFLRKAEFRNPDDAILANNESIKANDTYEWMWHGHPDSIAEHGVITEANSKDCFRFIFGKAGWVTFKLTPVGNETLFEIIQEAIPADEEGKANYHVGCSIGWTFYLANIKSILEGGHDLRNKKSEHKGVVNS